MSQFEIVMPKLGESITEATITKWFKKENDLVEEDDVLLEIATDKVDSEIPSPVAGKILKILFQEGDIVPVGKVIAIISLNGESSGDKISASESQTIIDNKVEKPEIKITENPEVLSSKTTGRFYSPVIRTIAKEENINLAELESLPGSGQNGRLKKEDVLNYLAGRHQKPISTAVPTTPSFTISATTTPSVQKSSVSISAGDEIIEMDRMRRIIADHMVMSKHIAPHVTNFVEADVTNLVLWRLKNKEDFLKREKINLTYMPVFIEATVKALKDFPGVNASVDGYKIIIKKNINLGIAVALPTGNLIVPVIKNADQLNLLGLAKEVSRLADAARNNKLTPDEIQGGTFSISNFGTSKNSFGTPIIPQPQVAILATGNIEKKPAVVETSFGDVIAIRHKMFLSLSYDHRIVDGALGGAFLRRLADYLEDFDSNRTL